MPRRDRPAAPDDRPVEAWESAQHELYESALDAFEAVGWDLAALDEDRRELVALWRLEADMANGGFLQLFVNWGAHLPLVERALAAIGADRTLRCLREMQAVVAHHGERDEPVPVSALPTLVTDDELDRLREHERTFDARPDPLAELVVRRYAPGSSGGT